MHPLGSSGLRVGQSSSICRSPSITIAMLRRDEADQARSQRAHGMNKLHFRLRTNRDLYVWGGRYLEWQRWGYISIAGDIRQYTQTAMMIP